MTTTEQRSILMTLIAQACTSGARLHKACQQIGISGRTLQRWGRCSALTSELSAAPVAPVAPVAPPPGSLRVLVVFCSAMVGWFGWGSGVMALASVSAVTRKTMNLPVVGVSLTEDFAAATVAVVMLPAGCGVSQPVWLLADSSRCFQR